MKRQTLVNVCKVKEINKLCETFYKTPYSQFLKHFIKLHKRISKASLVKFKKNSRTKIMENFKFKVQSCTENEFYKQGFAN